MGPPGMGPPVGFNSQGDMTPFTRFNSQGDVVPFVTNDRGDIVTFELTNPSADGSPSPFVFDAAHNRIPNVNEMYGSSINPAAAAYAAELAAARYASTEPVGGVTRAGWKEQASPAPGTTLGGPISWDSPSSPESSVRAELGAVRNRRGGDLLKALFVGIFLGWFYCLGAALVLGIAFSVVGVSVTTKNPVVLVSFIAAYVCSYIAAVARVYSN